MTCRQARPPRGSEAYRCTSMKNASRLRTHVPLALQLDLSESEVGSAVASAETTARDDSDDNDDSAAPNVRARATGQKWHARAHEMALEDAAAAAAMAAEAALGGAAAAVGAANAADVAVKKLERERAATAFAELSESSEEGQSQRVYAYSPARDTALGQSTQLDDDAILA